MTADPRLDQDSPEPPEQNTHGILGMVFRAIALAALALAIGVGASFLVMKNTGAPGILVTPR